MPGAPLEETLRRILREELGAVEERIASLETLVSDGFTRIDERFDRMKDALIIVAQASAGSIPEHDSYVTRKVRRTLERSGPPSPLAQAAKGGS